jgi:hypothetical protein
MFAFGQHGILFLGMRRISGWSETYLTKYLNCTANSRGANTENRQLQATQSPS